MAYVIATLLYFCASFIFFAAGMAAEAGEKPRDVLWLSFMGIVTLAGAAWVQP